MRPVHLYATVTTRQQRQLLNAVHGRWRVAVRIIMILLSAQGSAPPRSLVCCTTTRTPCAAGSAAGTPRARQDWPTVPDRADPDWAAPGWASASEPLLAQPKAWTTARVWRELGRPAISLRTLYRRIREQASWRRPRLGAKSDPDQVVAAVRERVAALPTGSVVLAEDETHLDWLARVRACWIPHGIRHLVPTPGSNRRHSLLGALNLATGAWDYHFAAKCVSVVFCSFLEQVLAVYPDAPVVAVLVDNDTTHTSGITARWLAAHPRLALITGARYSPQDNPVNACGPRSNARSPTPPRPRWPTGCARRTRSSDIALLSRCWRPQLRGAHSGCPRITDKTSGNLLSQCRAFAGAARPSSRR